MWSRIDSQWAEIKRHACVFVRRSICDACTPLPPTVCTIVRMCGVVVDCGSMVCSTALHCALCSCSTVLPVTGDYQPTRGGKGRETKQEKQYKGKEITTQVRGCDSTCIGGWSQTLQKEVRRRIQRRIHSHSQFKKQLASPIGTGINIQPRRVRVYVLVSTVCVCLCYVLKI